MTPLFIQPSGMRGLAGIRGLGTPPTLNPSTVVFDEPMTITGAVPKSDPTPASAYDRSGGHGLHIAWIGAGAALGFLSAYLFKKRHPVMGGVAGLVGAGGVTLGILGMTGKLDEINVGA